MKFKLDENLPLELSEMLSANGHDASTVLSQGLGGKPDAVLAPIILREKRVFVTLDTDFADVQTYPPKHYAGLIVLRLAKQNKRIIIRVFSAVIRMLKAEPVRNRLWIVEESRIRIRD